MHLSTTRISIGQARQPAIALGLLALVLVLGQVAWPAHAAEGERAAADVGQAASHEAPQPLEPQAPLALWTLVVFIGLLAVLWKWAWKPLSKALHDREEGLQRILREAEVARTEAERLLAEHRTHMAKVADEVRALIDKAHRDAEATSTDIIRKAQSEAEASRHRAEREIANALDEAIVEIWNKAADLAVSVASKVLTRELNDADHRRLIEVATSELPASPATTNGHEGRS
jgi:F-type H+-transporting ATPase subunit b